MTISVTCPHCSASYDVAKKSLGQKATCKKCERPFHLSLGNGDTKRQHSAATKPPRPSSTDSKNRNLLGRFEILDKLGEGAYGTVFRAKDALLNREVALKVPHPGAIETERDRERYLREPQAAAQLHHPYIVPVFDASFDGENVFVASAYIRGDTLKSRIQAGNLDFRESAGIVMKLADALDYAHSQGILHRDVKPANIMLDSKGEPLLMDFGLATLAVGSSELTTYGKAIGTPYYMPPEQAEGRLDQIGPHSDQYSLAVVLYELLTGERPFEGPPDLVISLVKTTEPEAPRAIDRAITKDLETICLKGMQKESSARYSSCGAMGEDLRRWLENEPIAARRLSRTTRTLRWCRRNPALFLLISVVQLLLVGILGVSIWSFLSSQEKLAQITNQKRELENRERQAIILREEAVVAQQEAENSSAAAIAARDAAKASADESLRTLYYARIREAGHEYDQGQTVRAHAVLDSAPLNHRNFEWGYLRQRGSGSLLTLHHDSQTVRCAGFNLDGTRFATFTRRFIYVWDLATGKKIVSMDAGDSFRWAAIHPAGEKVYSFHERWIKVWDVSTGTPLTQFGYEQSGSFRGVCFDSQGNRFATVDSKAKSKYGIWKQTKAPKRFRGVKRTMSYYSSVPTANDC